MPQMLYDKRWEETIQTPELPNEPWRKLLLEAADIIEQKGWTQGRLTSAGKFCMVGSLYAATWGPVQSKWCRHLAQGPDVYPKELLLALYALNHALGSEWSASWGNITQFNDLHATSKEEVVAKMREVANAVR
jgi:hypothetical protein